MALAKIVEVHDYIFWYGYDIFFLSGLPFGVVLISDQTLSPFISQSMRMIAKYADDCYSSSQLCLSSY